MPRCYGASAPAPSDACYGPADGPGSLMQRDGAARDVLRAYKMPEGHGDILHVFIEWVVEHHPHWFNHRRHPGYLPFDEFHWVIPQDAYCHSDE